jgi:hypothetical protein
MRLLSQLVGFVQPDPSKPVEAALTPGQRNGNWRHGNETKEAAAQRRMIRDLLREAESLLRGDK